jgi:ABC-2 type transport system permease protein
MQWDPLDLLGVLAVIVLGAAFFSTFSVIIASLLRTRDRVMGIGQLLTMPLFFASNAIYPIAIMPAWLQTIALVNPLTYLVDALRTMMIQGGESVFGLGLDFGVLITITTAFILLASRLYPKIVQ